MVVVRPSLFGHHLAVHILFFLGILPAFVAIWIRLSVGEPKAWKEAQNKPKEEQEKMEDWYITLNSRVTAVEESAKQAHKRIDCMEQK